MVRGYRLVSNSLQQALKRTGWSYRRLAHLMNISYWRIRSILDGDYPVSKDRLKLLVRLVTDQNPAYVFDPADLIEDGYLADDTENILYKCPICGTLFDGGGHNHTYCSKECYKAGQRIKRQRTPEKKEEPDPEPKYAESCYDESVRRGKSYGDVQSERTLEQTESVMDRWEDYQKGLERWKRV